MDKIIKIVLIVLLFGCLADMPYGYFQLVRFLAMAGFVYLAFESNRQNDNTETIVYVLLALLFQPFLKLSLGRVLWNVLDVIVALGLLGTLLRTKKTDNK